MADLLEIDALLARVCHGVMTKDASEALRALRAEVERHSATISDLTRERDAAREALIPLAEVADHCEHETNPEALVLSRLGDLRHARAALSPTTKGGAE